MPQKPLDEVAGVERLSTFEQQGDSAALAKAGASLEALSLDERFVRDPSRVARLWLMFLDQIDRNLDPTFDPKTSPPFRSYLRYRALWPFPPAWLPMPCTIRKRARPQAGGSRLSVQNTPLTPRPGKPPITAGVLQSQTPSQAPEPLSADPASISKDLQ